LKTCVFDIEGDGLDPTKIHCLSAAVCVNGEWRIKSTTNYDEMRSFFEGADVVIGHNIYRWDIPVVERILDIKVEAKIIDTLALSWYLYPDRPTHGLEDWGEFFGVPKPKIEDWHNLSTEEYLHRCEEDVKINCKLWDKQWSNLTNLYEDDEKEANRLIDYLMFKMDCAREAERSKWKLDVDKCMDSLATLELKKEDKVEQLRAAMPKVLKYNTTSKPDTLYKSPKIYYKPKTYKKKDGSLSSAGLRFKAYCDSVNEDSEKVTEVEVPSKELTAKAIGWLDLLESQGLPETHEEDVTYVKSEEEPNPNSTHQIKRWLFDLGWEPINFDYKDGREIPQVRIEDRGEKILCPSVEKLIEVEPALEALRGITVLGHRIGILKGYLSNVDDEGYVKASIQGLTNTLRFKHKVVVNLPSVSKPYGDIVRGVLIAPEGYELCGSDMSSLEDRTKQHYMWKHDPDYVREMQTEDFDPHLALAEFAGALTPEQVKAHKEEEEDHGVTRHLYKTANYSCTYGAGGKKLALTLDIPEKEGHSIVKAYRDKNWSIDAIAEDCKTKICLDSMWLYNPVSKFWYSLRHKKDRFSTLNQGTGVYCFDIWIGNFRKKRPQLTGQMHDEVILCIKKGHREACEKLLRDSVEKTNKQLKLNRELDIDVQFGENYAKIH
jgi:DNA polymerase III epsilon subunit-like protein